MVCDGRRRVFHGVAKIASRTGWVAFFSLAPSQFSHVKTPTPSAAPVAAPAPDAAAPVGPIEVRVPDIGDFKDVAVIELLVKPGDTVKLEQSLFTVESDKASMEIPSPAAGVIKELKVKIGDTVNIGDLVAVLEGSAGNAPGGLLVFSAISDGTKS